MLLHIVGQPNKAVKRIAELMITGSSGDTSLIP